MTVQNSTSSGRMTGLREYPWVLIEAMPHPILEVGLPLHWQVNLS